MPRNTTLDTILNTRHLTAAYRVLTVDLAWPTPYGEPPFAAGGVSVPAIGTPPAYDAATFDPAVWTDVSMLVSGFGYGSDIDQQCDALTLTVPVSWSETALDAAFRAMRAILVQARYTGQGQDTNWVNVAWCLSSGYAQQWDAQQGAQVWTVNALDALALAGLDIIGAVSGSAVYQADLVKVGGPADADHHDMYEIADTFADAWEYAVVDSNNYIHPNWADRPGPQFWCHNVPGEANPIPLAVGGEAVQAVFGEGVVRVGKTWAQTSPGTPRDFSQGLGFDEVTRPDIRCYLHRFAHPAIDDRDGNEVDTDIADLDEALTQIADPVVAGEVTVAGDFSALPQGLTIVLEDGTGARYATTSHEEDTGNTTFTLADAAAEVDTGTAVRYGEPNLATHVVRRWLLEAGYQVSDDAEPLYADVPDAPELGGAALPILLPPLVYREADRATRLQALADLRSQYAVIPSWLTRATADGQIVTNTVSQLFDSATGPNAAILPLWHATAAEAEKTDINVFTRVVARGRARQALDATQAAGVTIADVAAIDGGLPAPAHTLSGEAVRSGGSGNDYIFTLDDLFRRDFVPAGGQQMRPWAWFYVGTTWESPPGGDEGDDAAAAADLYRQWQGAALAEITLAAETVIERIELGQAHNWPFDHNDTWTLSYGGTAERQTPQVLRLDYWDGAVWKPLVSGILGKLQTIETVEYTADDFDSRAPVATTKLRIVCEQPWSAYYRRTTFTGVADPIQYSPRWAVGAWLYQVKVWGSGELRGVASLGDTAPFTGTFWEDARARLRRRTFVVPEVADWANTQALADSLAVDWLYEVTRNLAPRPVSAVRPDVRVGDTVRLPLPTGQVVCYGDGSSQLSLWRVYGMSAANTDDGVLYWSLTNSGTTRTVNLYSDSGRTTLVAAGSRTGDGAITLAASGSTISGTVTVAYTGNDTGTVAIPTYLVTAVEHSGQAGQPEPSRLVLVSYTEPYFEE